MYSGILRSRTDACFATLLPIFEDVMESATFCHDRLEILSIVEKTGSQHMVKGKGTNCVYKNVRISLLQNLSSIVASR